MSTSQPTTMPTRVRTAVRAAPVRVAVVLGAALGADVAFAPHQRHVPLCPLHAVTGLWCPLCGGLRAADSLAHGRFVTALHENALFVTSLPLLFACWFYWLAQSSSGRGRALPVGRTVPVLIAIAVVFTVVRNLPFVPGLRGA
jgi:hypothetical protein